MTAQWTYTFLDARTDAELAVLPVIGAQFEKVLNGTGKMQGFIPTGDPAIRAQDPWTATVPRRTCVAASLGDTLIWYGMIWTRVRSSGMPGLAFTAATIDSWLATQLLLADASFTGQSALSIVTALLNLVQSQAGANLGISVADGSPAGSTDIARNRDYPRTALKDVLTLVGDFLNAATPIEWRFDAAWKGGGGVQKTLVLGEPRIGRTTSVSDLNVWHDVTRPGSTLLTFTDTDDGSVQANAAVGAIGLPGTTVSTQTPTSSRLQLTGSGQLSTPRTAAPLDPASLFSYHTAAEVGVDEIGAGYPLIMRPVSSSGLAASIAGQGDLDDVVLGAVADGLSQGKALTGFAVGIDDPDPTLYDVGDDMAVSITHPGYPEFPAATEMTVRVLGRSFTPRGPTAPSSNDPFSGSSSWASASASRPDKVDLTVWDAGSARLPRSTTLVAHMRDLVRRVRALEQN